MISQAAFLLAAAPLLCESSRVHLPAPLRAVENTVLRGVRFFHANASSSSNVDQGADLGGALRYGAESCPCIGIDDVDGKTEVNFEGKHYNYPADVGGRCRPWEQDMVDECGDDYPPAYCEQAWCYVDPCNCNIPTHPPNASLYVPEATYQGKPLYYSYATCRSEDDWSEKHKAGHEEKVQSIEEVCKKPHDEKKYGKEECKCIGIDNLDGTTLIRPGPGEPLKEFPADVGARCYNWDERYHPDCKGASPPEWCLMKWCFVDPCTCGLKTPPKETHYLDEGMYSGRPLYYSHSTCGNEATTDNPQGDHVCVQYKDKKSCESEEHEEWCEWEEQRQVCLGEELFALCGDVGGRGGLNGATRSAELFAPVLATASASCLFMLF
jgi:hypothetical protein